MQQVTLTSTENISQNFQIAKITSILVVFVAHYFGGVLWVLASLALCIFAFSSSYFTTEKYRTHINIRAFWRQKILRLLPSLIAINLFLVLLFLIQGKHSIFSLDSLISAFLGSGVYNWFNVSNPSPFGAGLWFFTLLLMFYALYPICPALFRLKHKQVTLPVLFISSLILHELLPMGHMLWLTVFFFILGGNISDAVQKNEPLISLKYTGYSAILLLILSIITPYAWIKIAFIGVTAFIICLLLLKTEMRRFFPAFLLVLDNVLLEIYFLHTYLFFSVGSLLLGFFISLIATLAAAMCIRMCASYIQTRLLGKLL